MKRAVLAVAIVFVAAALIVASVYQSRKRAAAISKNMAASTKWAQEPTAFMGIQFGHPIDESLPKCADLWRTGQPECYRSFSTNPNNYLIYGVDGYTVGAEAINGKIEAVYAFFPSSDADRIGRALIAKYGTGYKEKTDDVTTRMGAKYVQQQLDWYGDSISISFRNFGNEIDKGDISATSKTYLDEIERRQQIADEEAKKKF